MTYGYNASAAFGNTTADIIDHAKGLLSSLIDKREEGDELRRPIIFVGHSLGGIVIKQALFQANIEPLYNIINKSTIGIIFLGTPHRGSEKAAYGKILATVATTVLHTPAPRLVTALEANSEALMRLTTDFRFQLPNYQVYSFYEMKPMKMFSSLVVEKHSALLEIDGEEQIPVDANHEEMCKFSENNNEVYEKLFKRIRRMLKAVDTGCVDHSYASSTLPYNKYYYVPYNRAKDTLTEQKRFVLYGLGGSGKTQACLKFAQDYRGRFWAIFWIDASSQTIAQQGFLAIARACEIEENPEVVRQWLSNAQEPWLLIIDNADDPSMDVSKFFPVGNRGSILVTTRNPDCKVHATVGSYEFGNMDLEDAVTLFLRAAELEDSATEIVRKEATAVVNKLGCLALAIVQVGAYVRQGLCSIEEYRGIYARHREKLLRHKPVQAGSDYKFSVYTTWEVSIEAIRKMSGETSDNAIELVRILCFLHYDGITEAIFERAWEDSHKRNVMFKNISGLFYIRHQDRLTGWDPILIREAALLLASFSLIKISAVERRISMHPLVHMWTRDCLLEDLQRHYWAVASYSLASSISGPYMLADYEFRRALVPHIDSCISLCKDEPIVSCYSGSERIIMVSRFALAFAENGRLWSAIELGEKVLEASQRTLGSEHPYTLMAMHNLAVSYYDAGRNKETMELREKVLEASQRTLGSEHLNTLAAMHNLATSYYDAGRNKEAMELREKVLETSQRTLGSEHLNTLAAMQNLAVSYYRVGRMQEAIELREKALEATQRTLGNEHPDTLGAMQNLALSYYDAGCKQEAMELMEKAIEGSQTTLGSEYPITLKMMRSLAKYQLRS